MTTDAAVAEPEVVQAPETPAEIIEETPSTQGDAANPTADAGAAPEPTTPDIDAEVEAFVKEQTQKGSEQAKPEAERQAPQVDPELLRMSEEARTRYQGNHKARHDAIDAEHESAVARLVEEGYTRTIAETLVAPLTKAAHDKLNEHHADSLRDAGFVSAYEQNRAFWQGVEAGVPKEHHEAIIQKLEAGKYPSYKDIAADLYELGKAAGASEGYAKGEEAGLRTGYRNGLTRKAELAPLSSDGQSVNGSAGGGGRYYSQMTAEERNRLSPAQRDAEVARERQARGV